MAKNNEFFLFRWFKRSFHGSDQEVRDIMQEEQVETPFKTMAKNFFAKHTVRVGLTGFILVFLFVLIGPHYWVLDLSEQDSTLINLPPSNNMMKIPSALKGKVRDIASGRTYGVGVDTDGDIYTWGHTRITEKIDIAKIPDEVKKVDLVMFAAGDDHVVAMDENKQLYVWGNTRLQQGNFTSEMKKEMKKPDKSWDIIQLEASNQFSAALSSDGTLYLWGNTNLADIKLRKQYQGNIAKVALTSNEYICLLKDGTVAYTGYKDKGSAFAAIPEVLSNTTVVDIASTGSTVAAVTAEGNVVVWGNAKNGEKNIPEFSAPVKKLYGGRFHYVAWLEDGEVVAWGSNKYHQTDVPASLRKNDNIKEFYTGNFQNYAVMNDGSVITWGLKGFLLGTDGLGRDMLTRIVNGGRITMTVGAISVVIAAFIGIILGGLAGYFGGTTDLIIMRIAEIVGGLPFIPFAMILSAVIGSRLDPTQRMYLIMVVLGVLSWTGICRLIRAQILAQREMEYVTAAKAMGIREGGIVFRHILPNVMSILLVSLTLDFATCMLTESTLSYLGFGIPLPTPTWGNLLQGANNSIVIQQYWWQWVFPAAIFGVCTICINMIGDGLRDAVDPKSTER